MNNLPLNQVLTGHCLDLLGQLPDNSIHACITSPPYFNLRNYSTNPVHWPAVTFSPMAGLPPLTIPEQSCSLGNEADLWAYVGHLVLIFREVKRILRDDGVLWLNLGDSYAGGGKVESYRRTSSGKLMPPQGRAPVGNLKPKDLIGIPHRVAFALQADGWWLRSDVIWAKPNPMPESVKDRPTKAHEYVFLLSKNEKYYYDAEAIREPHKEESLKRYEYGLNSKAPADGFVSAGTNNPRAITHCEKMGDNINPAGRNRRTVWTVATQPYPGSHFATFPPKLVEPMILAAPGEVCATCQSPMVRVIEKKPAETTRPRPFAHSGNDDRNDTGRIYEETVSVTTGWRPSCQCVTADPPARAIILDPFGGSGTVGQVAIAHRRNFILMELNSTYATKLTTDRLNGTQVKML